MEDFVLTLQSQSDGHLVRAECRLIGQATPHTISLHDRQRLEEFVRARPLRGIADAVEVGRALFHHLFGREIAASFRKALQEANTGNGLRILLCFDREDSLQDLPWELLHDGSWPLALNPATPIARYLNMAEPIRVPLPGRPIRVLLTAANPRGTAVLNLRDEERRICEHLKTLAGVELEVDSKITLKRLERLLTFAEGAGRPFHIWHHGGHGSLDLQENFHLSLEGDERLAGGEALSRILAACPNLLVAVLNVCHGAAFARSIACGNLPVAIGFREQIQDRAALLFAQQFYGSLLRFPVEVALARSRLALAYQGCPLLNWTNPVLYARTTRVVSFPGGRDGRDHGRG